VYVEFTGVARDGRAEIRLAFHPLAQAVWCGGVLMVFGALFAMWPRRAAGEVEALVREARTGSVTAGDA
jgi:cytochrome c biogenesis factor